VTLLNLGAWFSGRVDAPVCPSHRLVFRTPEDAPLLCQQRVLARNGNSCALPSATLARWEAYGKRRSENSVGRVGTNCSALADPYPDCLDALGHARVRYDPCPTPGSRSMLAAPGAKRTSSLQIFNPMLDGPRCTSRTFGS